MINVAYGKNVSASGWAYQGLPERAVDGDWTIGEYWSPGNGYPRVVCATTRNSKNEWVRVDLGKIYSISTVNLIGRSDCCSYQCRNWAIRISQNEDDVGTLCANSVDAYSRSMVTVTCNTELTGRYVTVSRAGIMVLCEIQVMVPKGNNYFLP